MKRVSFPDDQPNPRAAKTSKMQGFETSLLQKMQDLLERKPNFYDFVFYVGPEKKEVKAVKFLLMAASVVFEKEIEKEENTFVTPASVTGIFVHDFDAEAFQQFVDLTMFDLWTAEALYSLSLQPERILNLISICRHYEMKSAIAHLQEVMKTFYSSFAAFKETDDFLLLSQTNLRTVLASDSLSLPELDVFHSACRWAKAKCAQKCLEATAENIRFVLGDCLLEIRFPLMTAVELTQCVQEYNILTPFEGFELFKFIATKECQTFNFGPSGFPFKTKSRFVQVSSSEMGREIKSEFSILGLAMNSPIVDNPPFVCDGQEKYNTIATNTKILVHGLGFLGPLHRDAYYDVVVRFELWQEKQCFEMEQIEKCIFAQKDKYFRILFDHPIVLNEDSKEDWTSRYCICFSLKGPNTQSFQRKIISVNTTWDGDNEFHFGWGSNQLAEILYTNV